MVCLAIAAGVPWICPPAIAAESGVWEERAVAVQQATPLPAGTVWFRSWLKVPDNMAGAGAAGADLWRDSMTLTLRNLPGPVVVFLNGQKIIETRDVAVDKPQRFKVPKGVFEKGAYNAGQAPTPEVEPLLLKARQTYDLAERKKLYSDAQKAAVEQQYSSTMVHYSVAKSYARKKVGNVAALFGGEGKHRFANLWV